eukprot:1407341-Amphidinium_carterae.1
MKQTNMLSFARAGPTAIASEEARHTLRLSEAKRLGLDFPPQQKRVGRPKRQDLFKEAVAKALNENKFDE